MTMPKVDFSFAQLANTLPINRKALVITGPGDYVTRDGRRVTIHAVVPYAPLPNGAPRHELTAFEAKGAVWAMFRGTMRPRGLSIWHLSGNYRGLQPSPLDIVGPFIGVCAP
jgi:hypothetical protein